MVILFILMDALEREEGEPHQQGLGWSLFPGHITFSEH